MSRQKEPEVVTKWRALVKAGPPKCCYTCDNYTDHSFCTRFEEKVPEDFSESIDQCSEWVWELPF